MGVVCLCATQGWPNILEPLNISCHSISDFMCLHWTLLPRFSSEDVHAGMWRVLYMPQPHLAGIIKASAFGKLHDWCTWHNTNSILGGEPWHQEWLNVPSHTHVANSKMTTPGLALVILFSCAAFRKRTQKRGYTILTEWKTNIMRTKRSPYIHSRSPWRVLKKLNILCSVQNLLTAEPAKEHGQWWHHSGHPEQGACQY